MIRVIVLLLVLAALVILAVQNLSTSVALVILSGRTTAIPFGLLLVGAVGVGVLISLILSGLVGLRRSPDSKYRPMGRRVPYPDSDSDTARSPYRPTDTYSASSAFVTEPPVTPQDSAPGSGAADSGVPQDTAYRPSPPPPAARQTPPEKKKTLYQNDPDRDSRAGDDWGELRTAAQRDSWDEGGNAGVSSEQRGLFDFIRPGGGGGNNADQLSDDIATGWEEGPARYPADRDDSGYDGGLDRGWEGFESYDESPPPLEDLAYERRVYREGLYDEDEGPDQTTYTHNSRPGEIGPDGVYEADYRVIVPPSQPLDDEEDEDAEYYS